MGQYLHSPKDGLVVGRVLWGKTSKTWGFGIPFFLFWDSQSQDVAEIECETKNKFYCSRRRCAARQTLEAEKKTRAPQERYLWSLPPVGGFGLVLLSWLIWFFWFGLVPRDPTTKTTKDTRPQVQTTPSNGLSCIRLFSDFFRFFYLHIQKYTFPCVNVFSGWSTNKAEKLGSSKGLSHIHQNGLCQNEPTMISTGET